MNAHVGRGLRAEWLCECGHRLSEHAGENNEKCSACAKTQTLDVAGCRAGSFTNGLIREVILRARRRLPAVAA